MARRRGRRSYAYVKSSSRPVIRFRFKVVFIIFLLITAACFVIYMTGVNFGGDEKGTLTVTWEEKKPEETEATKENAEINSNDSESESPQEEKQIVNPVPEGSEMSQTYFSKCMFVGDSITVGLSDYQLVPMRNVVAEIGMNIEKINTEKMQTAAGESTALEAVVQSAPENVYIMLGSNGIAWLSIDNMINEYAEFAKSIKEQLPDVNIYIQSIPPVTAAREVSSTPISNSQINEYNAKLLELANANGYYYVDIHAALKGADGTLPAEDAADDGMHFNKTTYDKMIKYILSHVAQ